MSWPVTIWSGFVQQWFDLDQMRKTESEGRVIGGDLIKRLVVWCWSARDWCQSAILEARGMRWEKTKEVRVGGDREKKRGWERKKNTKIWYANATVAVHICTVTVAIVHKCTILPQLMWVFFKPKCVKRLLFFYFAQVYTTWCNCSNLSFLVEDTCHCTKALLKQN